MTGQSWPSPTPHFEALPADPFDPNYAYTGDPVSDAQKLNTVSYLISMGRRQAELDQARIAAEAALKVHAPAHLIELNPNTEAPTVVEQLQTELQLPYLENIRYSQGGKKFFIGERITSRQFEYATKRVKVKNPHGKHRITTLGLTRRKHWVNRLVQRRAVESHLWRFDTLDNDGNRMPATNSAFINEGQLYDQLNSLQAKGPEGVDWIGYEAEKAPQIGQLAVADQVMSIPQRHRPAPRQVTVSTWDPGNPAEQKHSRKVAANGIRDENGHVAPFNYHVSSYEQLMDKAGFKLAGNSFWGFTFEREDTTAPELRATPRTYSFIGIRPITRPGQDLLEYTIATYNSPREEALYHAQEHPNDPPINGTATLHSVKSLLVPAETHVSGGTNLLSRYLAEALHTVVEHHHSDHVDEAYARSLRWNLPPDLPGPAVQVPSNPTPATPPPAPVSLKKAAPGPRNPAQPPKASGNSRRPSPSRRPRPSNP